MDLATLIAQADWRLPAYLQACEQGELAGWRRDASLCPTALWIEEELGMGLTVVTETCVIACAQRVSTPLLLALFLGQLDAGAKEQRNAPITGRQALCAFRQAEQRAAQRLLPRRAESRQCAFVDEDGARCQGEAATPWMHAFYARQMTSKILQCDCIEFHGVMCAAHWSQVVCPPDSWWERVPCPESALAVPQKEEVCV